MLDDRPGIHDTYYMHVYIRIILCYLKIRCRDASHLLLSLLLLFVYFLALPSLPTYFFYLFSCLLVKKKLPGSISQDRYHNIIGVKLTFLFPFAIASHVLTFEHEHPVNLSISKSIHKHFHLVTELTGLSSQHIDTTTKGSGQDSLHGERIEQPMCTQYDVY